MAKLAVTPPVVGWLSRGDVEQFGLAVPLHRTRNLRHLHSGLSIPSCMRAPPEAQTITTRQGRGLVGRLNQPESASRPPPIPIEPP